MENDLKMLSALFILFLFCCWGSRGGAAELSVGWAGGCSTGCGGEEPRSDGEGWTVWRELGQGCFLQPRLWLMEIQLSKSAGGERLKTRMSNVISYLWKQKKRCLEGLEIPGVEVKPTRYMLAVPQGAVPSHSSWSATWPSRHSLKFSSSFKLSLVINWV